MLRFLPKMFSSGRVYHNRLFVTFIDLLVIYAFFLSFRGYIHWAIAIFMAVIVAAYYVRVSYIRFFKIVMENKLLKTNVAFDNGFIYASLIVEAKNIDDEPVEIRLPVKVAYGSIYQRYVLYVYMNLCNSLTLYARKLKKQEDNK